MSLYRKIHQMKRWSEKSETSTICFWLDEILWKSVMTEIASSYCFIFHFLPSFYSSSFPVFIFCFSFSFPVCFVSLISPILIFVIIFLCSFLPFLFVTFAILPSSPNFLPFYLSSILPFLFTSTPRRLLKTWRFRLVNSKLPFWVSVLKSQSDFFCFVSSEPFHKNYEISVDAFRNAFPPPFFPIHHSVMLSCSTTWREILRALLNKSYLIKQIQEIQNLFPPRPACLFPLSFISLRLIYPVPSFCFILFHVFPSPLRHYLILPLTCFPLFLVL